MIKITHKDRRWPAFDHFGVIEAAMARFMLIAHQLEGDYISDMGPLLLELQQNIDESRQCGQTPERFSRAKKIMSNLNSHCLALGLHAFSELAAAGELTHYEKESLTHLLNTAAIPNPLQLATN